MALNASQVSMLYDAVASRNATLTPADREAPTKDAIPILSDPGWWACGWACEWVGGWVAQTFDLHRGV